jgi:hypothetical protein
VTEPERLALRRLIDARRREQIGLREDQCPETLLSVRYAYRDLGCRCTTCRSWSTSSRRGRRKGSAADRPSRQMIEHGASAYRKRGCRCEVCTAANSAECRAYKARRRAAA